MRHTEIELDSFNGSSANGYSGKFNLQLPAGITYKEITLHGINLNNNQLKRVMLSLNGDAIYDVTGEQLRLLQNYKNEYIVDSKWVIPFADFSMTMQEGQNLSSLVTLPGENVVLQVETDAPTALQEDNNSVASISGEAVLGISQGRRAAVPRLYTDVLNGGVAGENRYRNFVNQNKTTNPVRIRRVHMLDSSIDNVEIKRNGITLFDKTLERQNYSLKRLGKSPQNQVYHFDPVKTNFGVADTLVTSANTFEIITNKTEVGDFEALFETVEFLPAPV